MKTYLLPLLFIPLLLHGAPIHLEDRRELFVDHTLIESLDQLDLRLHAPRYEGVALSFDQPWEGPFSAYPTVILDGHRYMMFYRGMPGQEIEDRRAITAYAESVDGIHWVKPQLGRFEHHGSSANNIVLAEKDVYSRNFSPFLDTNPDTPPEQRFKAIAGDETKGLYGFVSADGLNWELIQEDYIFTQGMFDSHNVAFWSEAEQQYVCYFRTWTGEGFTGYRTISRTTSKDFLNWTNPGVMTYGDTPQEQLYTNGTQPYFRAPHIYIALAKRFFPEKSGYTGEDAKNLVAYDNYRSTSSDSIFMSTRGGASYDRTFMEAFIRPGDTARDWIARDNTPALGLVPALNGRELYIYRMSHYAQPTAHIARYSLRLDGFVSAHADYNGGTLTTKPFTFTGNRLEVNLETSAAGELRVELTDKAGNPLPGFSTKDCEPMLGNFIDQQVSWKGSPDLSQYNGQVVRLKFHLKDGDLYAFRFSGEP